ncbi:putative GATA zinc finger domain-containing protein 25 [Drosophila pseudoobscura]|uniref:GATA zinc finger domain-containing protein 25 n=1 Tax=Drosophila pseudoobscura pseudoobscura TaxID=46245 RepID=A0A6I8W5V3_DROPS|nr:putative GATA zinc finger domain-containing protein 25 [Drosophila pseudoobscura]
MAAKQQRPGVRFPKAAAQISRQHDLNYCTQQQQQQQQQHRQHRPHQQLQHPRQQQQRKGRS